MEKSFISKEQTQIIKGFAILFMIAHHCLIKEFYIHQPTELLSFGAIRLQVSMKICVGIFTFFVGYGTFYANKFDFHYIISHVLRLLKQYWFVLFLTIFLSFLGGSLCWEHILGGLFGLTPYYNLGNWYVYFYIYALLILPLMSYCIKRKKILSICSFIFLPSILSLLIKQDSIGTKVLYNCLIYTPILAIGFVAAYTQFYVILIKFISHKFVWIILAVSAIVLRTVGVVKGFNSDIIYVPLFIFSISAIGWNNKILMSLGKNSTFMWFFHAIPLSTATAHIFQDNPIWINNPFFLFIALTIISYLFAVIARRLFHALKLL